MSVKPVILTEDASGLILFHHSQSFYCQKVLFALNEKRVPFRQYEINVVEGEQFSDWYLEMSPKAELPLLKSGSLIVPGGAQIINYVENAYTGGEIKDLLPPAATETSVNQILQMSRIISRLPIGAISKGAFANATAMHLNPKMPFIQPVRDALLNPNERLIAILKLQADKSIKYRRVLEAKVEAISRQPLVIPSRVDFEAILLRLEELLDIIESLLKSNSSSAWFLSDRVTILDICFGILLHRLDMLGLNKRLWGTTRINIAAYFHKVQQLPSYQLSIPSHVSNARAMWGKLPDQYKYAGLGLISASSLGLMGILGKAI